MPQKDDDRAGNRGGQWHAEGSYEAVAEKLFNRLAIKFFFLEYDSPRAGDFAPLRFVKNKGVVLGLVSSKLPALESLDALKRRTEEATKFIDLDHLAISPQCGFASTMEGNLMTEEQQWQKLKLVVDTAVKIWGQA